MAIDDARFIVMLSTLFAAITLLGCVFLAPFIVDEIHCIRNELADEMQRFQIDSENSWKLMMVIAAAADRKPRQSPVKISGCNGCATNSICPPGPPGPEGPPGDEGTPAPDGLPGVDGFDGDYNTSPQSVYHQCMMCSIGAPGPRGPPGAHGQKGSPGPPGQLGPSGIDGVPGERGDPGLLGGDGGSGIKGQIGRSAYGGMKGSPGPKGDPGQQGLPGPRGSDGNGRNKAGPSGKPGGPGLPGLKGNNGLPGLNGTKGVPGTAGSSYGYCSCNDTVAASLLKNEQLPQLSKNVSTTADSANIYVTQPTQETSTYRDQHTHGASAPMETRSTAAPILLNYDQLSKNVSTTADSANIYVTQPTQDTSTYPDQHTHGTSASIDTRSAAAPMLLNYGPQPPFLEDKVQLKDTSSTASAETTVSTSMAVPTIGEVTPLGDDGITTTARKATKETVTPIETITTNMSEVAVIPTGNTTTVTQTANLITVNIDSGSVVVNKGPDIVVKSSPAEDQNQNPSLFLLEKLRQEIEAAILEAKGGHGPLIFEKLERSEAGDGEKLLNGINNQFNHSKDVVPQNVVENSQAVIANPLQLRNQPGADSQKVNHPAVAPERIREAPSAPGLRIVTVSKGADTEQDLIPLLSGIGDVTADSFGSVPIIETAPDPPSVPLFQAVTISPPGVLAFLASNPSGRVPLIQKAPDPPSQPGLRVVTIAPEELAATTLKPPFALTSGNEPSKGITYAVPGSEPTHIPSATPQPPPLILLTHIGSENNSFRNTTAANVTSFSNTPLDRIGATSQQSETTLQPLDRSIQRASGKPLPDAPSAAAPFVIQPITTALPPQNVTLSIVPGQSETTAAHRSTFSLATESETTDFSGLIYFTVGKATSTSVTTMPIFSNKPDGSRNESASSAKPNPALMWLSQPIFSILSIPRDAFANDTALGLVENVTTVSPLDILSNVVTVPPTLSIETGPDIRSNPSVISIENFYVTTTVAPPNLEAANQNGSPTVGVGIVKVAVTTAHTIADKIPFETTAVSAELKPTFSSPVTLSLRDNIFNIDRLELIYLTTAGDTTLPSSTASFLTSTTVVAITTSTSIPSVSSQTTTNEGISSLAPVTAKNISENGKRDPAVTWLFQPIVSILSIPREAFATDLNVTTTPLTVSTTSTRALEVQQHLANEPTLFTTQVSITEVANASTFKDTSINTETITLTTPQAAVVAEKIVPPTLVSEPVTQQVLGEHRLAPEPPSTYTPVPAPPTTGPPQGLTMVFAATTTTDQLQLSSTSVNNEFSKKPVPDSPTAGTTSLRTQSATTILATSSATQAALTQSALLPAPHAGTVFFGFSFSTTVPPTQSDANASNPETTAASPTLSTSFTTVPLILLSNSTEHITTATQNATTIIPDNLKPTPDSPSAVLAFTTTLTSLIIPTSTTVQVSTLAPVSTILHVSTIVPATSQSTTVFPSTIVPVLSIPVIPDALKPTPDTPSAHPTLVATDVALNITTNTISINNSSVSTHSATTSNVTTTIFIQTTLARPDALKPTPDMPSANLAPLTTLPTVSSRAELKTSNVSLTTAAPIEINATTIDGPSRPPTGRKPGSQLLPEAPGILIPLELLMGATSNSSIINSSTAAPATLTAGNFTATLVASPLPIQPPPSPQLLPQSASSNNQSFSSSYHNDTKPGTKPSPQLIALSQPITAVLSIPREAFVPEGSSSASSTNRSAGNVTQGNATLRNETLSPPPQNNSVVITTPKLADHEVTMLLPSPPVNDTANTSAEINFNATSAATLVPLSTTESLSTLSAEPLTTNRDHNVFPDPPSAPPPPDFNTTMISSVAVLQNLNTVAALISNASRSVTKLVPPQPLAAVNASFGNVFTSVNIPDHNVTPDAPSAKPLGLQTATTSKAALVKNFTNVPAQNASSANVTIQLIPGWDLGLPMQKSEFNRSADRNASNFIPDKLENRSDNESSSISGIEAPTPIGHNAGPRPVPESPSAFVSLRQQLNNVSDNALLASHNESSNDTLRAYESRNNTSLITNQRELLPDSPGIPVITADSDRKLQEDNQNSTLANTTKIAISNNNSTVNATSKSCLDDDSLSLIDCLDQLAGNSTNFTNSFLLQLQGKNGSLWTDLFSSDNNLETIMQNLGADPGQRVPDGTWLNLFSNDTFTSKASSMISPLVTRRKDPFVVVPGAPAPPPIQNSESSTNNTGFKGDHSNASFTGLNDTTTVSVNTNTIFGNHNVTSILNETTAVSATPAGVHAPSPLPEFPPPLSAIPPFLVHPPASFPETPLLFQQRNSSSPPAAVGSTVVDASLLQPSHVFIEDPPTDIDIARLLQNAAQGLRPKKGDPAATGTLIVVPLLSLSGGTHMANPLGLNQNFLSPASSSLSSNGSIYVLNNETVLRGNLTAAGSFPIPITTIATWNTTTAAGPTLEPPGNGSIYVLEEESLHGQWPLPIPPGFFAVPNAIAESGSRNSILRPRPPSSLQLNSTIDEKLAAAPAATLEFSWQIANFSLAGSGIEIVNNSIGDVTSSVNASALETKLYLTADENLELGLIYQTTTPQTNVTKFAWENSTDFLLYFTVAPTISTLVIGQTNSTNPIVAVQNFTSFTQSANQSTNNNEPIFLYVTQLPVQLKSFIEQVENATSNHTVPTVSNATNTSSGANSSENVVLVQLQFQTKKVETALTNSSGNSRTVTATVAETRNFDSTNQTTAVSSLSSSADVIAGVTFKLNATNLLTTTTTTTITTTTTVTTTTISTSSISLAGTRIAARTRNPNRPTLPLLNLNQDTIDRLFLRKSHAAASTTTAWSNITMTPLQVKLGAPPTTQNGSSLRATFAPETSSTTSYTTGLSTTGSETSLTSSVIGSGLVTAINNNTTSSTTVATSINNGTWAINDLPPT